MQAGADRGRLETHMTTESDGNGKISVKIGNSLRKSVCTHSHLCINERAFARDVMMETENNPEDCIKDVV